MSASHGWVDTMRDQMRDLMNEIQPSPIQPRTPVQLPDPEAETRFSAGPASSPSPSPHRVRSRRSSSSRNDVLMLRNGLTEKELEVIELRTEHLRFVAEMQEARNAWEDAMREKEHEVARMRERLRTGDAATAAQSGLRHHVERLEDDLIRKDAELAHARFELERTRSAGESDADALRRCRADIDALQDALHRARRAAEESSAQGQDARRDVDALRMRENELHVHASQLEAKVRATRDLNDQLAARLARAEAEAKADLDAQRAVEEDYRQQLHKKDRLIASLRASDDGASGVQVDARLRSENDGLRRALADRDERIRDLEGVAADRDQVLDSVTRKMERLGAANEALDAYVHQLEAFQEKALQDGQRKQARLDELSPDAEQDAKRIRGLIASSSHDLAALAKIIRLRVEGGQDPNMSLLLGSDDVGSPSRPSAIGAATAAIPPDGPILGTAVRELAQLRSEINALRALIAEQYAERIGQDCRVQ